MKGICARVLQTLRWILSDNNLVRPILWPRGISSCHPQGKLPQQLMLALQHRCWHLALQHKGCHASCSPTTHIAHSAQTVPPLQHSPPVRPPQARAKMRGAPSSLPLPIAPVVWPPPRTSNDWHSHRTVRCPKPDEKVKACHGIRNHWPLGWTSRPATPSIDFRRL